MTDRHALDLDRLGPWLAERLPDAAGVLTAIKFPGGQSNPTYAVSIDGALRFVLRKKPGGALLPSAHAIEREYQVTAALRDSAVPVATPLLLCEDAAIVGTPFFVMAHVPGRTFWDARLPDLAPTERAAVYDETNRVLAALHRIDPDAVGLAEFGRPNDYLARQVSRWTRQYRATETMPIAAMERLIAWLPANLPARQERRIVHGDYRSDNIIFAADRPVVRAVIDWELSTLGDPLGDLTYHMMEWFRPEGVDVRGTLQGTDLAALGIPSPEDYARRYCERTGFRCDPNHPFYRAFNLFRVAAILQGIAGRARDGVQTASNADEIVTRIGPLAKAAWSAAQDAGAT